MLDENAVTSNPDRQPLLTDKAIEAARTRTFAAREAAKLRPGYKPDPVKTRPEHEPPFTTNTEGLELAVAITSRLHHLPLAEAKRLRDLHGLNIEGMQARLAEVKQAVLPIIEAEAEQRKAAGKPRYGQRHKSYVDSMSPDAGEGITGGDLAAHVKGYLGRK